MKPIGYIAVATPKKRGNSIIEYYTPLAYGEAPQPGPEELLMGRGATLFKTEKAAITALEASLIIAAKSRWVKTNVFQIWPVYAA